MVLVTGASSGIGAAIAIQFAAEGAKVAMVARNEKKLYDVSEKCEKVGSKPLVIIADVSKDEDAKRIISQTIESFGKLDVLVNNAGIGQAPLSILSEEFVEVFDRIMSVNLRSVVVLTNLAAPHLVETKGNVVNISSIAAKMTINGLTSYCTSKAGMDHFTRCVALELAPKGVRVNVINPGAVKTDIIENMGMTKEESDKIWDGAKTTTPLQRIGDPEEIADLTLFLASDVARSITGSTYVSDNGGLLK